MSSGHYVCGCEHEQVEGPQAPWEIGEVDDQVVYQQQSREAREPSEHEESLIQWAGPL